MSSIRHRHLIAFSKAFHEAAENIRIAREVQELRTVENNYRNVSITAAMMRSLATAQFILSSGYCELLNYDFLLQETPPNEAVKKIVELFKKTYSDVYSLSTLAEMENLLDNIRVIMDSGEYRV